MYQGGNAKLDADCLMSRCPSCDKHYSRCPALSRRDNKTEICPACGTREAMEDFVNATTKGSD